MRRIWFGYCHHGPVRRGSPLLRRHRDSQVLGTLATGQPSNPHYYLRSIPATEHARRHPDSEADLIDRLAQTVRGADADDQRVA